MLQLDAGARLSYLDHVMGRDEQILELAHVVKVSALQIFPRLPRSYHLDDLIQAGWIGAIHAVDRYDSKFGASLRTYARHVIWGAMLDHLRKDDYLPRSQRRKEIVERPLSLEVLGADVAYSQNEDRLLSSLLAAVDVHLLIKRSGLSSRERTVLCRYGEDPTCEIAGELNISTGRVRQINTRAIELLRKAKTRKRKVVV